jgi:hypothetical protein
MSPNQFNTDNSSNVFLTGVILLANLDMTGLYDYAIKAAIGGAIWLTFKLTSDFLSEKIKRRNRR